MVARDGAGYAPQRWFGGVVFAPVPPNGQRGGKRPVGLRDHLLVPLPSSLASARRLRADNVRHPQTGPIRSDVRFARHRRRVQPPRVDRLPEVGQRPPAASSTPRRISSAASKARAIQRSGLMWCLAWSDEYSQVRRLTGIQHSGASFKGRASSECSTWRTRATPHRLSAT